MLEWELGGVSLLRIVESEAPIISCEEIFPDWQEQHLSENLDWLVPRFFEASTRQLIFASQEVR